MARYPFTSDVHTQGADWFLVYTDAAGVTQTTDLLTIDGNAITTVEPEQDFLGPDGVAQVWMRPNNDDSLLVPLSTSDPVPATVTTVSAATTGTTIGVNTVVDANTVRISYTSPWGIDSNGNPYYVNGGVATAGEAAILCVNPTTGNFAVVRPDGTVAV